MQIVHAGTRGLHHDGRLPSDFQRSGTGASWTVEHEAVVVWGYPERLRSRLERLDAERRLDAGLKPPPMPIARRALLCIQVRQLHLEAVSRGFARYGAGEGGFADTTLLADETDDRCHGFCIAF